jgi:hypothetical protein
MAILPVVDTLLFPDFRYLNIPSVYQCANLSGETVTTYHHLSAPALDGRLQSGSYTIQGPETPITMCLFCICSKD